MAAFFELLLFAAAALAALLLGGRSRKRKSARGVAVSGTIRCPHCGSPAAVRGALWECPYCGDSGIAGRRCRGQRKANRNLRSRAHGGPS